MRIRIAALAGVMMLATACRDSSGPGDSMFGTYTLVSVNGAALPATFSLGGIQWTAKSGTVSLYESADFSISKSYVSTANGQSVTLETTCSGFWANIYGLFLNQFASPACDKRTMNASRSGNTLTVEDESVLFVYKR